MARFAPVVVLAARLSLPTPVMERWGADELVEALNRHWRGVAEPIRKCGGAISSFAGEELIAWFSTSDQAGAAVQALLGHEGGFAEKTTLGIMEGDALEARLGVSDIVAPMVLGEPARLAHQLAVAAGRYGARAVSGLSLSGMPEREVDRIRVRGTSAPLQLVELAATEPAYFALFRLGYAHYLAQEWDQAQRAFARCDDDRAAGLLLSRVAALRAQSPEPYWDGVYPHS